MLDESRDKEIEIMEMIFRKQNKSTNRHLCTTSLIKFILESAGWTFPDLKLITFGSKGQQYEICFDFVKEVNIEKNRIAFTESFSETIHRISNIKINV